MSADSSRTRAWLELLRPPNLFTVPGDPLAGFCLTVWLLGPGDVVAGLCSSLAALLIYAGGLIGNDVADIEEDRRDRPARPIPSGRTSRVAAFTASALCAASGLAVALGAGCAAFMMACLTQSAVMAYNGWLKRFTVSGSIGMGACRGFSFLMGAAAANPGALCEIPVLVAAAGILLYVAGITWIADRETSETRIGPRRWVPVLSLLGCFSAVVALTGRPGAAFTGLCLVAAGWAFHQGRRLRGVPPGPVLGSAIGGLIRGLLPTQSAFAALAGVPGLAVAAALLLLWPVSTAVAKRFYAT